MGNNSCAVPKALSENNCSKLYIFYQVGQTIAFGALLLLDRRHKPIVCPTSDLA